MSKLFGDNVQFCIVLWPKGAQPSQQLMTVGNTPIAARQVACAAAVEQMRRR